MPSITVDQAKLVMNTFAAIFQNNLISSDFVTWKQYDTEMNDRNGLTVVEQVGPRYAVTRTTNGVQDLTTGVQDTVFGSEQYKVNTVFGSSMGWGDFVKIRDIGDARESTAISRMPRLTLRNRSTPTSLTTPSLRRITGSVLRVTRSRCTVTWLLHILG
jgi:hypothetical protein